MHWLLYRSERAGCERHCEGVSCLNFCPHVAKINDNQNKINNKDKLYHCLDGLVKICVGNCWIAPVEASVTDFTCGFVYQSLLLPAEGLLDWSTQQSSGEKLSALSMHQEDCYKSMLSLMSKNQKNVWFHALVPGISYESSSVRRRTNAFNLIHQLNIIVKTGVPKEKVIQGLKEPLHSCFLWCMPCEVSSCLYWRTKMELSYWLSKLDALNLMQLKTSFSRFLTLSGITWLDWWGKIWSMLLST